MDKDRHTISATELSKFEYCPYQWYYERVYGRTELRRLAKERNERLGLEDKRSEWLEEGVKYHKRRFRIFAVARILTAVLLLAVIAVVVYMLLKGGVI